MSLVQYKQILKELLKYSTPLLNFLEYYQESTIVQTPTFE